MRAALFRGYDGIFRSKGSILLARVLKVISRDGSDRWLMSTMDPSEPKSPCQYLNPCTQASLSSRCRYERVLDTESPEARGLPGSCGAARPWDTPSVPHRCENESPQCSTDPPGGENVAPSTQGRLQSPPAATCTQLPALALDEAFRTSRHTSVTSANSTFSASSRVVLGLV